MTSALRWGWVVSATPRPLYPRETPLPIIQEAGWAPGPVWTDVENSPPPRFDPRTVQPVASRYTDWAITALLYFKSAILYFVPFSISFVVILFTSGFGLCTTWINQNCFPYLYLTLQCVNRTYCFRGQHRRFCHIFTIIGQKKNWKVFGRFRQGFEKVILPFIATYFVQTININPLNTKRRPLYLKTQFVPRSKHFSSRL